MRFVGVPSLSELPDIRDFVADTGVGGFDHIPDVEGVIWDRFDVSTHRTYILINDDGTLTRGAYGELDADVQDLIAR